MNLVLVLSCITCSLVWSLLLATTTGVSAFQLSFGTGRRRGPWSFSSSSAAVESITTGSKEDRKEQQPQDVLVFDEVFSSQTCQELHQYAVDYQRRSQLAAQTRDASMFQRSSQDSQSYWTPLEFALDSYLTALNDTSPIVEYWTRQRHLNLNVHADLDERLFDCEQVRRCPQMGHVLYLDVATAANSRGPTCVFPNQKVGWGYSNNHNKGQQQQEDDNLIIVPAIPGRVLRFPGSAMHGVPFPAHRWLLSEEQEKELGQTEEEMEAYEQDMAPSDNYGDRQRSVVLFNTWNEPPQDVLFDNYYDHQDTRTPFEHLKCNPEFQWQSVPIQSTTTTTSQQQQQVENDKNNDDYDTVRINLTGKQARRFYPFAKVRRIGSVKAMFQALTEETKVTQIQLQDPINNSGNFLTQKFDRFVVRLLSGPGADDEKKKR